MNKWPLYLMLLILVGCSKEEFIDLKPVERTSESGFDERIAQSGLGWLGIPSAYVDTSNITPEWVPFDLAWKGLQDHVRFMGPSSVEFSKSVTTWAGFWTLGVSTDKPWHCDQSGIPYWIEPLEWEFERMQAHRYGGVCGTYARIASKAFMHLGVSSCRLYFEDNTYNSGSTHTVTAYLGQNGQVYVVDPDKCHLFLDPTMGTQLTMAQLLEAGRSMDASKVDIVGFPSPGQVLTSGWTIQQTNHDFIQQTCVMMPSRCPDSTLNILFGFRRQTNPYYDSAFPDSSKLNWFTVTNLYGMAGDRACIDSILRVFELPDSIALYEEYDVPL